MFRRVIWIVLDSVGIGAMPDAAQYGAPDPASDTLGNIARIRGLERAESGAAGSGEHQAAGGHRRRRILRWPHIGRCTLASPGKDTTTGHWEMAGIHLAKPFPLFPHGFPPEIMHEFETRIGRSSLGNKAASGTEIIQELGAEHMRTGSPIVYTSADSVFQVAAHEEVIPLWELYKICETAREILRGPYEVGRVIARPFVGSPGHFTRTANRHDYAVPPPAGMLLDRLEERGVPIHSVGKIFDVFLGRGIGESTKTKNNAEGMAATLEAMEAMDDGLVFVNLVDFDQQYGHRNDIEGYGARARRVRPVAAAIGSARCARTIWRFSPPTTAATPPSPAPITRANTCRCWHSGRTREHGVNLGLRASLSDIGQTVAQNFGAKIDHGESFLPQIL